MKRFLSLLLAVSFVAVAMPLPARAEETGDATVENDITVEGANDFGELLSDSINEAEAEEQEAETVGYNVTDLVIDGATATVTYETLEDANLVVALYTEDGVQMLASGSTEVTPEATTATVAIEGELPQYFLAKAFLMDDYDFSPLCSEYTTPLYTQEMQELLASTADDYDPERVLALDDTRETNFAVYAETTVRIPVTEGVNTLTDNGDGSYTITSADESFTALQPGDVFSYEYTDGEMLIAKVADIAVDGTTVTITEDEDIEMSDVFSQVKIENEAVTNQFTIDKATGNEGVTLVEPAAHTASRAIEGGESFGKPLHFEIVKAQMGDDGNQVNINGTLDFSVLAQLNYYVSFSRQYIKFVVEASLQGDFDVTGKITNAEIELNTMGWNIGGDRTYARVGLTPVIIPAFEAAVHVGFSWNGAVGFDYTMGGKVNNLSTKPVFRPEVEIEGAVSLTLDLNPNAGIVLETMRLVSLSLSTELGMHVSAHMAGSSFGEDNSKVVRHTCAKCLAGSVFFRPNVAAQLTVCGGDPETVDIWNENYKLIDFHYSFDHDEWGVDTCPYVEYRITILVLKDGKEQEDIQVLLDDENVVTNRNGVAELYHELGTVKVTIQETNGAESSRSFLITPDQTFFTIRLTSNQTGTGGGEEPGEGEGYDDLADNIFGTIGKEEITDDIIDSGKCGDNVWWKLDKEGVLTVGGKGKMDGYTNVRLIPWYMSSSWIKEIIVEEGITQVTSGFSCCDNVLSVTLPSTVTRITAGAFCGCEQLRYVVIPEGVTEIENGTFENCYSLQDVVLPMGLQKIGALAFADTSLHEIEIPDTVTEIGASAFQDSEIEKINIPNGVTIIRDGTFQDTPLIEITIPEGVTEIERNAFGGCHNLTRVEMPESVEKIGDYTFAACHRLESITLPERLKELGNSALRGCTALTSVIFPAEIQKVGYSVLTDCTNLERVIFLNKMTTLPDEFFMGCGSISEVILPSQLEKIGKNAFNGCKSLEKIFLPDSISQIAENAFFRCENLLEMLIPEGVIEIGAQAFADCQNLKTVKLPQSLEIMGASAFNGCQQLAMIELPEQVKILPEGAFSRCATLKMIKIPAGVQQVGSKAFAACDNLEEIWFSNGGVSVDIAEDAFLGDTLSIYYPQNSGIWDAGKLQNYGGTITWIPYTQSMENNSIQTQHTSETATGETASPEDIVEVTIIANNQSENQANKLVSELDVTLSPVAEASAIGSFPEENLSTPSTLAAVGGEYGTTETGSKTASFTGLKPGGSYVLLALANVEAEKPLAADNLLYITQGSADETGNLQFTYIPRMAMGTSYVVACGPSTKDLADAEITVPVMYANGAVQTVRPTVVYDGETLTEGVDYVLAGQVSATEPGDYQCTLRGIYNYTGTVTINYTLSDRLQEITSDTYEIVDGLLYLSAETTANTLLNGLVGTDIGIAAADGAALTGTALVGTGAMLAQGGQEAELTVVFYGDLTGDGKISSSDMLEMQRAILGISKLEGVRLKAATPRSGDSEKPQTTDMLQMRRVLLGIKATMLD